MSIHRILRVISVWHFFWLGSRTDYETLYPNEAEKEDTGDDARVWRVCNQESSNFDYELVNRWLSILDSLFIFVSQVLVVKCPYLHTHYQAALFSAVVASFLVQTTQSLHKDNTAISASLLTELVLIQRAIATSSNVTIPHSTLTFNSTFTSTSQDVWLNSLWFTSLALTLVIALVAGFVKQWLLSYLANNVGTSPKIRALTRQYRYRGVVEWGVPSIIESLPVLMNIAIFLFFIGLILYTRELSGTKGITGTLLVITLVSFTAYVLSSLLPVWIPQCPYKTSLTKVYGEFIKLLWCLIGEWVFSR